MSNIKTLKTKKRGFTLIELLVVIAIIGLLSSIVLASLNSAREKSKDAAIKANLKTIQTQAEIFYSDNLNYGPYSQTWCGGPAGTVFSEPTIKKAVDQLFVLEGGNPNNSKTRCHVCPVDNCINSTMQSYHIAVELKSGGIAGDSIPDTWCVDSAGHSKSFTYASGQTIDNAVNTVTNTCN